MCVYTAEPVQAKTVPVGIYYMETRRYKNSPVNNPGQYTIYLVNAMHTLNLVTCLL